MKSCSIAECAKAVHSSGIEWCTMHYTRVRRTGTTEKLDRTSDPAVRLKAGLRLTRNGCHVWTGGQRGNYGSIWAWGETWSTHRLAWTLENGQIPDGHVICHKCDNPPCCNPEHLFLGTSADNNADARAKKRAISPEWLGVLRRQRTHCKQGHEFNAANTYVTTKGERACRTCKREWGRQYYRRTRGISS